MIGNYSRFFHFNAINIHNYLSQNNNSYSIEVIKDILNYIMLQIILQEKIKEKNIGVANKRSIIENKQANIIIKKLTNDCEFVKKDLEKKLNTINQDIKWCSLD